MKKERFQKRIAQILSRYFAQELADAPQQPLITIQDVVTSPRGDFMKVWLSFLPTTTPFDAKAYILTTIEPHRFRIQQTIAHELRHLVRQVPKEIRFAVDDTPEKAAHIDRLIAGLQD